MTEFTTCRATNFLVQDDQHDVIRYLLTAYELSQKDTLNGFVRSRINGVAAFLFAVKDPVIYPLQGCCRFALSIITFDCEEGAKALREIFVAPFQATALAVYLLGVAILGVVVAELIFPYVAQPLQEVPQSIMVSGHEYLIIEDVNENSDSDDESDLSNDLLPTVEFNGHKYRLVDPNDLQIIPKVVITGLDDADNGNAGDTEEVEIEVVDENEPEPTPIAAPVQHAPQPLNNETLIISRQPPAFNPPPPPPPPPPLVLPNVPLINASDLQKQRQLLNNSQEVIQGNKPSGYIPQNALATVGNPIPSTPKKDLLDDIRTRNFKLNKVADDFKTPAKKPSDNQTHIRNSLMKKFKKVNPPENLDSSPASDDQFSDAHDQKKPTIVLDAQSNEYQVSKGSPSRFTAFSNALANNLNSRSQPEAPPSQVKIAANAKRAEHAKKLEQEKKAREKEEAQQSELQKKLEARKVRNGEANKI